MRRRNNRRARQMRRAGLTFEAHLLRGFKEALTKKFLPVGNFILTPPKGSITIYCVEGGNGPFLEKGGRKGLRRRRSHPFGTAANLRKTAHATP
ncbi:MAG: hypothetical protein A3E78_04065 [Alphaproteobacteria bacterium RIFCSPHIGHO2_12_FULL_63_12]|nr:MAG: hypothetical protein A3E78_04065 [Alphaproteobacteria bacterium RIFCSPHIGHO2_12_FULL_63_12]